MTQFYSRIDTEFNGDVYSIPFSYLKKEEINVYINNELFSNWMFLNESQIKFLSIPSTITSESIVSIRRITDISEKIVDYTNNTILAKDALNLSQDQLLDAIQEIYDNNEVFKIDTEETLTKNKQNLENIIANNKQEILDIQADFETKVDNKLETVNQAADKINQLETAVNTAVDAATTACEKAESVEQILDTATIEMTAKLNNAQQAVLNATEQAQLATQKVDNALSDIQNATDYATQKLKGLHYPVFCFNSGLVDEQGQSALCSLENDILTQHAPCVCTTSDGQTFIVSEDVTLDISELSDGDYNVFYFPETKEMKAYANTVYIQDNQPSLDENDIWVDTSVMPYITRQNISGTIQDVKCVQNARLERVSGGG